jgi:hypothetical protein
MRKQLTDRESFQLAEKIIKHVIKKNNCTESQALDRHNAVDLMERVGVNNKIILEYLAN